MRYLRPLGAFLLGFTWLYLVQIQFRGFLAARQVSADYFRFFGAEHQDLALFTVKVALHLIPEALAMIGGLMLSAFWFKGKRGVNAAAFAFGAVVSYVFWLVVYHAAARAREHGTASVNWSELFAQFQAPWWTAPALLSPSLVLPLASGLQHVPTSCRIALRPNPSLEPTSSGTARKPAVWLLKHLHTSGLRAAPPGSAQLER